MTACKKKKGSKSFTIEELYQNKNFVKPKEQNLETIFEEPKQAKNGSTVLTSTRKYKRYLDFDPTTGKVQKRKNKVKNCFKKIKKKEKTRSATIAAENFDMSVYLKELNDSSDECDNSLKASECENGNHVDTNILVNVTDKKDANENHNSDASCKNCTLKENCACKSSSLNKVKEKLTDQQTSGEHLDTSKVIFSKDEAVAKTKSCAVR